jgi:hypothetical protein
MEEKEIYQKLGRLNERRTRLLIERHFINKEMEYIDKEVKELIDSMEHVLFAQNEGTLMS